jgi:adenine-specific DNA-methyltransferase
MPIEKIEAGAPASQSADLVADNLAQLRALFPELVTEGKTGPAINVDVLKALVGDTTVTDADEKYGLNWHGKRAARQLALTPSTGTLRPCPEESVDWDTTQNLMIEGDNLEVLKLLQKSYAGKVKLIYIDPPYNTGRDFVYPDKFQDSIGNYLALTGQAENGKRTISNTESSGRFHTDWLNMIYPRLKLARNLLKEDGVIFVSIDDREFAALMAVLQEIFGDENFVGVFVWKRRTGAMDSVNNVSTDHEYVVCYSRSVVSLNGEMRTFEKYENPDDDPRGPWIADNLSAAKPGGDTYYPIKDPASGNEFMPPKGRYWPYSRATMTQKISEGRIIFPKSATGSPLLKRFKSEAKSLVQPVSTWVLPASDKSVSSSNSISWKVGHTSEGTKTIKDLFDEKVFTYAKPLSLLDALISQATSPTSHDIVLDFFAGSGTTGHATVAKNAQDGGNRRYILVQLPEPLSDDLDEQKDAAAYCDRISKPRTIAELTKERLRRASKSLATSGELISMDRGFKCFKLDVSNVLPWSVDSKEVQKSLLDGIRNIAPTRSALDLLYEMLLKLGIDLAAPILKRQIAQKTIYSVGYGALLACLEEDIAREDVEALGNGICDWLIQDDCIGRATCIFRDDSFADDVAKLNLVSLLDQRGVAAIRSV